MPNRDLDSCIAALPGWIEAPSEARRSSIRSFRRPLCAFDFEPSRFGGPVNSETPDLNSQRCPVAAWSCSYHVAAKKTSKPKNVRARGFHGIPDDQSEPGCGNTFELRIMPRHTGALAGVVSCPLSRRLAGSLKSWDATPGMFAAKPVLNASVARTDPKASSEDSD